jgi:hypothetical protein
MATLEKISQHYWKMLGSFYGVRFWALNSLFGILMETIQNSDKSINVNNIW